MLVNIYVYGNQCDSIVAMATIFYCFNSCVSVKLL